MKVEKWLYFLFFCDLISSILSLKFNVAPSRGCYWNVTCQNKWSGDCAMNYRTVKSNDHCEGLCPEQEHPSCPLDSTRFYCCILETAKVIKNGCQKCENKIDNGDEYKCCSDCSDPGFLQYDTELGYCKTGGELVVEPIPKEIYKWIVRPWKPCSSFCGGGIRSRNVECYAVFEDILVPDYPVYDHKCSAAEMPAREEDCIGSCQPSWTLALFIFLAIVFVVGSIGFAGYAYYKWTAAMNYGRVYVMMEDYI